MYELFEDCIGVSSDGKGMEFISIDERIPDEELFEYKIINREDFIDNLIDWIAECRIGHRELMKDDLKMLIGIDDEYIFSSISINDYVYVGCSEFDSMCKELIELNGSI